MKTIVALAMMMAAATAAYADKYTFDAKVVDGKLQVVVTDETQKSVLLKSDDLKHVKATIETAGQFSFFGFNYSRTNNQPSNIALIELPTIANAVVQE